MLTKLEALYDVLHQRLASQKQAEFLFGYRPSTADVYLFSHLARIQAFPNTLKHVVDAYPLLQEYYERVMNMYFIPLENDKDAVLTTNQFIINQGLVVEVPNPSRCFTKRKYPCRSACLWIWSVDEVFGKKEDEEDEESVYSR